MAKNIIRLFVLEGDSIMLNNKNMLNKLFNMMQLRLRTAVHCRDGEN